MTAAMGETSVHLGEDWEWKGTARDADGVALDLAGATVSIRVRLAAGADLDAATTVVSAAAGTYSGRVTPAAQVSAGVVPGAYPYQVRIELGDGRVTDQATGTLRVLESLF